MAEVKVNDEITNEVLDAFLCPITREIMVDPVILISDGHTYEKSAISKWFDMGGCVSPMTGNMVSSYNTISNHTIKKAIDEFLTKFPKHKKQKLTEIMDQIHVSENMNESVIEFLKQLKQSKYIKVFAENEIYSMDVVKKLTRDDLKNMIQKIGPVAIIYDGVLKLHGTSLMKSGINYVGQCRDHNPAVCNRGYGQEIDPQRDYFKKKIKCNQCNSTFKHDKIILYDCLYRIEYAINDDIKIKDGVAYPDYVDVINDIVRAKSYEYLAITAKVR